MKKAALALLALIAFFPSIIASPALALDEPNSSQKPQEDSWTTMATMPTPRVLLGIAVVNDRIYTIAGNNQWGKTLTVNEMYDPITNTWITKAPVPITRRDFATAVYQNKIYCIGGYTKNSTDTAWQPSGINQVYDTATDTWETKSPMPIDRWQLDAYTINNKIYLVGGEPDASLNMVYDPLADNWTTASPIQYSEIVNYGWPPVTYNGAYGISAALDNKIYWIGTVSAKDTYQDRKMTLSFDPQNNNWTVCAPPPNYAYVGQEAVSTTGIWAPKRIYTFGLDAIAAYDPVNDSWSRGKNHKMFDGFALAVVDDEVYMMGGSGYRYMFSGNKLVGLEGVQNEANEKYTPFGYGTVAPIVSVLSPQNSIVSSDNLSINISINRPFTQLTYSLDGQEKVTVFGNFTLSGLKEGLHNVIVYARDSFGNEGTSEIIQFNVQKPFQNIWLVVMATAVVIGIIALMVYRKKTKLAVNKKL